MWVVINPPATTDWWPTNGRITPLKGKWDVQAWFGREQDIGMTFKIAVILINKEDDQYYQDYLTEAQRTGDYSDIPLRPNKIMDSITVTRK